MTLPRRITLFSFILTAVILGSCAREETGVLARVGDETIQIKDFKTRYEKFLRASGTSDNIVQRRNVLQNMVNEVLILGKLRRDGWFEQASVRKRLTEIRLQAMLDRYAVKFIAKKIQVTEKELWEEFRHANAKVSARYLYAKTESGAWDLKRKLLEGTTFQSLARTVFSDPGLASNGGYLGYFGRGEMDARLEEVAFSLPIGELSDPVRIGVGYAIVKVEDRVDHPLLSENDYAKQKGELEDRVRTKKTIKAIEETVRSIARELSPEFVPESLTQILAQWDILQGGQVFRAETVVSQAMNPDAQIVRFEHASWSVQEFLEKLEFTTSKQRARVKSAEDLKELITGLAAREVLLERATKDGIDQEAETVAQIQEMTLRYALKEWAAGIERQVETEEVSEDELRRIYEMNKADFRHAPQVNVAEILVRTLEEAEQLRNRLDRGKDFSTLAKAHSIRLWAAKKGGELGYLTIDQYGTLGEKFAKSNVGAILGPEFVDPYYGLFKILGKKDGRQKSFSESRESILEGIRKQRKLQALQRAAHELRTKTEITIDENTLAEIRL
ncbi:MAG TPA: peptidylprolyl isomerase [Bacteroidota bacterium]|nr:peptidylprolyl isomerase [Bacteroidota bacterium]